MTKILFKIVAEQGGMFLFPGDTTSPERSGVGTPQSLYEYAGTEKSEPVLVGVRNRGRLDGSPHANEGAELISQCGTRLGSNASSYNAVSASGETVLFTALGRSSVELTQGCEGVVAPVADELYARVGGAETVAISEPAANDCGVCDTTSGQSPAVFRGASEDGSKVFFTTSQELLPGAQGENLYEYEIDPKVNAATKEIEFVCPERPDGCVTLVSSGSLSAEVKGLAQVSPDGSHVYFVAGGVLTGANAEGRTPVAKGDNLYVYDAVAGTTRFIGTLAAADLDRFMVHLEVGLAPGDLPSQSTPDGAFLVFTSSADLVAGDTSTVPQVFEYDAQSERLRRVSVGQDGYDDNGNTTDPSDAASIEMMPEFSASTVAVAHAPVGILSDDGSRVFFASADALTSQTPSGLANNVYEWEREGMGSCGIGDGEGCVYLISDGRDNSLTFGPGKDGGPSVKFVATDSSGEDAFFTTADQLVPGDTDTQIDVYDARVGGGFPEPPTAAECAGSACQERVNVGPSGQSVLTQTVTSEGAATSREATPKVAVASSRVAVEPKPKSLTRAQELAKVLKRCRTERVRARREACEAQARRRYGSKVERGRARRGGRR